MTTRTAMGVVAGLALGRLAARTLGVTPAERVTPLPGDGLVADAPVSVTRAISIAAPPERVWPWLVQIGQDRGGFYSYDAVENLFGLDVHSAERIEQCWQDLAVGDPVRLAPGTPLRVAALRPRAHLVLAEGPGAASPRFSWAFVLRTEPGGTRLVVRERYAGGGAAARLGAEALVPVSAVMTRRMLRGIRERAERAGQAARPGSGPGAATAPGAPAGIR
ncbi:MULTISPECIES: hypothetical protein [unclassified Pseudonocardia]|uniref:hypothetical protein n=1 Tax=unclassified Pseudonocardia TaxID=2619320 RepID=UPI00094B2CB9|nr:MULTISPECIES: hypothetical protein [unclassified Pseudonocardia]